MIVVFLGPSVPSDANRTDRSVVVRPPACQGDIMQAVGEGATAIGLIDGQFEYAAAVWHKELLFALSKGITVMGAASMGALRAVECAPFGMVGIGRIFEDYASGRRFDDGDVALSYGPAELGYPALSIPLVNVDATLEKARCDRLIDADLHRRLTAAAGAIFFKDRTWARIARVAEVELPFLKHVVAGAFVDQKRLDALQLLDIITRRGDPPKPSEAWTFNGTPLWRKMYGPDNNR